MANLKFSGDGVSTIVNIGTIQFENGAVLEVSELNVPNGTYTLVNSDNMTDNGLAFAAGTDTTIWSFDVDTINGDLKLIKFDPTPPPDPLHITAWYSAADHGSGVGEVLLEIPDDFACPHALDSFRA